MKSTRIGFLAIILCSCSVGGLDSTESVGIPATFKVAGMESRTAIGERNASGARPISWEKVTRSASFVRTVLIAKPFPKRQASGLRSRLSCLPNPRAIGLCIRIRLLLLLAPLRFW